MLKFRRSRSRKGKRKETDAQSNVSEVSQGQEDTVVVPPPGYTILKPDKELPKLHKAAWNSNTDKVFQLLEETSRGKPKYDVNAVDKHGRTPLHLASVKTSVNIIKYLKQYGCEPSCKIQDEDGNVPLHKAIEMHMQGNTMQILEIMDNVDIKNKRGHTPLHTATLYDDVLVANKLLDKGAYFDENDNNDYTPLALAAITGKVEFVELMIKEGANVNPIDKHGRTPLMLAVINNHTDIVKVLVEYQDTMFHLKDNEGKTAADYCQPETEIAQILAKHNPVVNDVINDTSTTSNFPFPVPQRNAPLPIFSEIPYPISYQKKLRTSSENLSRDDSFMSSDLSDNENESPNKLVLTEEMRQRIRKTFSLSNEEINDDTGVTAAATSSLITSSPLPAAHSSDKEEGIPPSVQEIEEPVKEDIAAKVSDISLSAHDEINKEDDSLTVKKPNEQMNKERKTATTDNSSLLKVNDDTNIDKSSVVECKKDEPVEESYEETTEDDIQQHIEGTPKANNEELVDTNWDDWDSSDYSENDDDGETNDYTNKLFDNSSQTKLQLEKPQENNEESSKWDSSDNDELDDDLDLPEFGLTPRVHLPPPTVANTATDDLTTSNIVTSSPLPTSPKYLASNTPSSTVAVALQPTITGSTPTTTLPVTSTHTYTAATSANTGVIVATDVIPPVSVVETTLQSQDSNTSSSSTDNSCNISPTKLVPPQTSTDLAANNDESDEAEELEKEMLKQLQKPVAPRDKVMPVMAVSINEQGMVNSGLKALISERKKANREFVSTVEEDEALKRKQDRENEIFKVLEQRKRATEGDNISPVRKSFEKMHNKPEAQSNTFQTMKDKWEKKEKTSLAPTVANSLSPNSPPLVATNSKHQSVTQHHLHVHTSHEGSSAKGPSDANRTNSLMKQTLEFPKISEKLETDLELRSLHYEVEQLKEELRTALHDKERLSEQLNHTENLLKDKVEVTQSTELKLKELEVDNRSLTVHNKQLQDDVQALTSQLQSERNQSSLKETDLQEQKNLYSNLQEQATKEKGQYSTLLDEADSAKKALEEELISLRHTKTRLESELLDKSSQYKSLENEKDKLRNEISNYKEKELVTDNALTELRSKAELLTATLDKEIEIKKSLESQVSSLTSQLTSVLNETSQLKLDNAKHDKEAIEQNQQLLRDKMAIEKDLTNTKEEKQRLLLQFENTQNRLIAVEQELKSTTALITDKSNQVANLQRQLDQQQLQQLTSQETSKREQDKVTHLEAQLSIVNEKLNVAVSEQQKLTLKADNAEKKATGSEIILKEEKIKMNTVIESLQNELKKANSELQERTNQLLLMKEQLASNQANTIILEKEVERLQKDNNSHLEHVTDLQNKIKLNDSAYELIDAEKKQLEEELNKTNLQVVSEEQQLLESKEIISQLKEMLNKTQLSLQETVNERDGLILERVELESKLTQFDNKIKSFLSELDLSSDREKQYQNEIDQLNQSRLTLQELATKLRSETVSLECELEEAKTSQTKAENENTELKQLWENEVKAKHKIMEKFMVLEQTCKESGDLVDNEKLKVIKAIEQKSLVEMKMETLHERNGQLQRENGELKGQLKLIRKRFKANEKLESTAHHLQLELDQTQTSLQTEISSLNKQINICNEQLKKESEIKQLAEQTASKLKLELTTLQKSHSETMSTLYEKERAFMKSESSLQQLKNELSQMKENINSKMVPCTELDSLKKELEVKNQEEISQKMVEINDLLEQQTLSYQKLDSIRASQENERRSQQDKEIYDLKHKLNTVLADTERQHVQIEHALSEAKRYQTLYEQEVKKKERLLTKLERTREKVAFSRSQLSYERNQARKLYDSTCNAIPHFSPNSLPTSTPLKHKKHHQILSPPSKEMLQSIHSELDRSLAKHLDSVSFKGQTQFDRSKVESHLDTIRRNYRI